VNECETGISQYVYLCLFMWWEVSHINYDKVSWEWWYWCISLNIDDPFRWQFQQVLVEFVMFLDGQVWPPLSGEVTVNWTNLKEGCLGVMLMMYRLGFPGGRGVLENRSQLIIQFIHLSGPVKSVRIRHIIQSINSHCQSQVNNEWQTTVSSIFTTRERTLFTTREGIFKNFEFNVSLSLSLKIVFVYIFMKLFSLEFSSKYNFWNEYFFGPLIQICPMITSLLYVILGTETYNIDWHHTNDQRRQDFMVLCSCWSDWIPRHWTTFDDGQTECRWIW